MPGRGGRPDVIVLDEASMIDLALMRQLPVSVYMDRLDDTAVEELDCPTVECRDFAAMYTQHRQRILQAVEDTNFWRETC